MPKPRLAILMGGPSSEHDVSLQSALNMMHGLSPRQYDVAPIFVSRDLAWQLYASPADYLAGRVREQLLHTEIPERLAYIVDAALIAMHGEFGEDGQIQRILDRAGVPYQGSGPKASALAFDKQRANQLLKRVGLHIPDFMVLTRAQWVSARTKWLASIPLAFGMPVVIKPNSSGSSVGVHVVRSVTALADAIEEVSVRHDRIIVQRFVKGQEVTCAVIETDESPLVLPPTLIRHGNDVFSYQAKYQPGLVEEITPAPLPPRLLDQIRHTALRAHRAIGCRDYSRTDMILGQGRIWVLEINTLPGLTAASLLPQAAEAQGISLNELLDHLVYRALHRPEVVELSTYEYHRKD